MRVFRHKHNLPAGVVEPVLKRLVSENIIIRVSHNTFVPGKDPDDINLCEIYAAIRGRQSELEFDMTSGEKDLIRKIDDFETEYINNLSTLNVMAN